MTREELERLAAEAWAARAVAEAVHVRALDPDHVLEAVLDVVVPAVLHEATKELDRCVECGRENVAALRAAPWDAKDEARARELAWVYVEELKACLRMLSADLIGPTYNKGTTS